MAVKKLKSTFWFHRLLLNGIVNNPAKLHWNPMRTVGGVVILCSPTDEQTHRQIDAANNNTYKGKNQYYFHYVPWSFWICQPSVSLYCCLLLLFSCQKNTYINFDPIIKFNHKWDPKLQIQYLKWNFWPQITLYWNVIHPFRHFKLHKM